MLHWPVWSTVFVENVWQVWGDSARCDLFLSNPWDVPTEPDTTQAAGKVLPMTFAALSISGISEILGKLYRNAGTRSTGTGGRALCPEGTPRVAVGMAGSGCINTGIRQNWHRGK